MTTIGSSVSVAQPAALADEYRDGLLSRSIRGALTLFFIATLLVPAAPLNKAFFGLLLGLSVCAVLVSKGTLRIPTLAPFAIAAIFVYGYLLAFFNPVEIELSNQFLLAISVLMLIYPIYWYRIDLDPIAKLSGVVLAFFTVGLFVAIIVLKDSSFAEPVLKYFVDYSLGAVGEREFGGGGLLFMFHAGTVPFLFLTFCLYFQSFVETRRVRDVVLAFLILIVAAGSTSRALILTCAVAAFFLASNRMRPKTRLVFVCVCAVFALLFLNFLASQTAIFDADEFSNAVKIGHARSFVENTDIVNLLFGEGLGSYYFSLGRNMYLAHTEITLLDLMRWMGFVPAVLAYLLLMFPQFRLPARSQASLTPVVVFGLYVLISLTNPVLFNSYGLLIVLWYWSKVLPGEKGRYA
jgi:hypothetical protein